MKNIKIKKIIYFAVAVLVLIASILPIVLSEDASLTEYSAVSLTFALCSVIYAVIAFSQRNKGNLFVAGKHWVWRALRWSFSDNRAYTESDEYKKEFELSAFIWCITIPAYVSSAFFAGGFYSALSQALGWTIFRTIVILILCIALPMIKHAREKKQQRLRDEADRKEQERRESMGKWN